MDQIHLENLTFPLLVKLFPAFYVIRILITVFTKSCHLSLHLSRLFNSNPILKIHFNIIPSAILYTNWSLYFRFPHQNPVCTPRFTHTCYMPYVSHCSCGDCSSSMWRVVQITVLFNTGDNVTASARGNFSNILQGANSHWRIELQDVPVLPGYDSVSVGDHTPKLRRTVRRWLLDVGASLPRKKGVFSHTAKKSPDIRKLAEFIVYRQ